MQVPQYILEEAIDAGSSADANIVCTQPRRLPAVALAGRVADEMGTTCGAVVGYSVRLNKRASAATRLLFCTTGILLRRLIADPTLAGVSHVIIDEVHERSLDSDLLLLLLRDTLAANPQLRLVLMSATADSRLFVHYLDAALQRAPAPAQGVSNCTAVVEIPGFTYPVRELALEDAIAATGACSLACMRPEQASNPVDAYQPACVQHRTPSTGFAGCTAGSQQLAHSRRIRSTQSTAPEQHVSWRA